MKDFECFKIEESEIYYAINLKKGYYIRVLLTPVEATISLVQNRKKTTTKHSNCVANYQAIPSEEFIRIQKKADAIQNSIPFN